MKDLLEKLSSYNLFNNFFPGILFAALVDQTTSYKFLINDIVVGVFLYYFYGIIIGRVGSLVIDPLFKRFRIIRYASYPDFIKASQKDKKIELLLESNNMYRTLISVFFCLLLLMAFEKLGQYVAFFSNQPHLIGAVFLMLLFCISYRKQTAYIRERILHSVEKEDTEVGEGQNGTKPGAPPDRRETELASR
jgi:hypothetical protein